MTTGITLIRNGQKLKYPWQATLEQMFNLCKRVIINVDPGEDETLEEVLSIQADLPKEYTLDIHISSWNMGNSGDGRELANQANVLLPKIPDGEWVLYCQADEMIHERDVDYLNTKYKKLYKF